MHIEVLHHPTHERTFCALLLTVQAIPSFLTIAVMPMTYSVAYGVVAGLASYIIINGCSWLVDACHLGARRLPVLIRQSRQSKV